jgi:glycosyltransferase involved in cell wall biosynthesis
MNVSVIIPTYNSAAFIGDAIGSVMAQTRPVHEVVVIDDGSTDSTQKFAACHPEIRWIAQKHSGPSAARNNGIRQSRTEFVAFLDSDDLWLPDKIERQMGALALYPSAGFSFATMSTFSTSDVLEATNDVYIPQELRAWWKTNAGEGSAAFGSVYQLLLNANCMQTSSVVARRDALIEAGMFDESLIHGEDHDLWLRLARRWPAVYIVDPVAKYRIHSSALSGSGRKRQELFYRSTIETISRHVQAFPSFEASKALANSYNNYTAHLLKVQRWKDAKQSAGKSLRAMPTPSGFRLLVEATFPRMYSRAVTMLHGGRAS